ncbi:hypothetical protein B0T14DRAFT_524812 [Immersiella caudata]|uniref:Uncharacterized protein n=1 Tax=Immersiella caudata TaxID=314043 RepID=A0AA39WKV1_9PEZI|nr:hypothetical protein B0T14DRAFT_524812 [Immersiella caudata]
MGQLEPTGQASSLTGRILLLSQGSPPFTTSFPQMAPMRNTTWDTASRMSSAPARTRSPGPSRVGRGPSNPIGRAGGDPGGVAKAHMPVQKEQHTFKRGEARR